MSCWCFNKRLRHPNLFILMKENGGKLMKVKIRENRGVVIFDLKGRIIGPDGAKLRKLIVEQVPADVAPKLILNLFNVTKMDGGGLGAMVSGRNIVAHKGGRIGIINVGRQIRNLLVMTKLMTVFDHFDSESQAIASLNSA